MRRKTICHAKCDTSELKRNQNDHSWFEQRSKIYTCRFSLTLPFLLSVHSSSEVLVNLAEYLAPPGVRRQMFRCLKSRKLEIYFSQGFLFEISHQGQIRFRKLIIQKKNDF